MPTRKPRPCNQPGCPTLTHTQYCEQHAPKPWANTTHKRGVNPKWRALVYKRDRGICRICHQTITGPFEADHIQPLAEHGEDTLGNICVLHPECHATKTKREAARGRARSTKR